MARRPVRELVRPSEPAGETVPAPELADAPAAGAEAPPPTLEEAPPAFVDPFKAPADMKDGELAAAIEGLQDYRSTLDALAEKARNLRAESASSAASYRRRIADAERLVRDEEKNVIRMSDRVHALRTEWERRTKGKPK